MDVLDIGRGRPLVLLHGWSCTRNFWRPQIEALNKEFRLIVPDLPGHGRSKANPETLSIAAIAGEIRSLIAECELDRPIVVGWSMGALAAFDLIRQFGTGDLGGLVVVDMTPRLLNDSDWTLGLQGFYPQVNTLMLAAIRSDWPTNARLLLPRLFARGRPLDPDLVEWMGREMGMSDPEAMAVLWESMAEQDYRALLPTIDLPSLVIQGGESQLYAPEVGAYLASRLPRAERACCTGSGHAPHLEEPQLFNTLLRRFADRLTPAGRRARAR